MKKANLKFDQVSYLVEIDDAISTASKLYGYLPLVGEAKNIGGEIFFRTDELDIPFDGSEKEEFEVGDIVYWRSPRGEKKFAIAFFYGNTKFSDWKIPRAAGPCVKIGKIVCDVSNMGDIESGQSVSMETCCV